MNGWLKPTGVIDGVVCLLVSTKGYTSLEITMGQEDLALIRYLQDKLGGSLKKRSGVKAYRYRLQNREAKIQLINCIKGYIRQYSRVLQLHRVAQQLNISVIEPMLIDRSSQWFAGFKAAVVIIGL